MRYTTPRYREAFRHLAYEGDYPFYARSRKLRNNGEAFDLDAARAPFIGRAKRLQKLRARPGRLLDLGCGDGFFCDLMRTAGWDVVAVDIEEDVIWHAKEKLGLKARVLDIENDGLPKGPFDAITLWGVLQLMYDPRDLLQRIHEQLAPNGIVGLGVSNVRSLGAALFRGHWRGSGVPRHLSHFTPNTMERLAKWCDYRVEQAYFETPKWIVSGSVDDFITPRPARLLTKAALISGSKIVGSSRAGDTMEYYLAAESSPNAQD
jgi:SAM-dependent methyltransferase